MRSESLMLRGERGKNAHVKANGEERKGREGKGRAAGRENI